MINLKNKRMIGAAVSTLLLAGSLGGTVFAAQKMDVVKKDVLMTEKVATNNSIEKTINENEGNTASVTEQQAVDITQKALKTIFDVEVKDGGYTLETEYFDQSKNDASYKGRSIWSVYFTKVQSDRGPFDIKSAFIDAKTGEILSMSSQNSTDAKATQVLSQEAAKSMVTDFVQAKELTKGTAIKDIQVNTKNAKKVIVVEVNLENGKGLTVLINSTTNKIMAWQNRIGE
jgi:uncharacterized protein (UPF0262 family)